MEIQLPQILNSTPPRITSVQALELFEDHLATYLNNLQQQAHPQAAPLGQSIAYSLQGGGKRFRPAIGLALAEAFGVPPQRVLPWLLAIEMIHTYSLIHDDLPCLDNDDLRRGRATNHKVFGEPIALLAGDSLASEAFRWIAHNFQNQASLGLQLVLLLAEKIGPEGMVKGQVLDLVSKDHELSIEDLLLMHELKTGFLIQATLVGTAMILGLPKAKIDRVEKLSLEMGLAFQIKDDLLDSQSHLEIGSLPHKVGLVKAQQHLEALSQSIQDHLQELVPGPSSLRELVTFNLLRQL